MSAHNDVRWARLRKELRPRLVARLPHPCPRCGGPMTKGMRLDLGHISRNPVLFYDASNVRLEHMRCNRQDGQRITTALRVMRGKRKEERMPRW